jgi:hypothetical protein
MYMPSHIVRIILGDDIRVLRLTPMEPFLTGGQMQTPVKVTDVRSRQSAEAIVPASKTNSVRDLVSVPLIQDAMAGAYLNATGEKAKRPFEIEWDETVKITAWGQVKPITVVRKDDLSETPARGEVTDYLTDGRQVLVLWEGASEPRAERLDALTPAATAKSRDARRRRHAGTSEPGTRIRKTGDLDMAIPAGDET